MKRNKIKYLIVLFSFALSAQGYASDQLNCTLKKTGSNQPDVKMSLDKETFSYKAQLDSISAEVGFYSVGGNNAEFIETISLSDGQTGVRNFFGHNVECPSNQCPSEQLDIKTGWLQLDLGNRGTYQVWCTLH